VLYNNITYVIDLDFKERKKSYQTLLMCSFPLKENQGSRENKTNNFHQAR
jgi:hypothetical protein